MMAGLCHLLALLAFIARAGAQAGCEDDSPSCTDWAAAGECDKNRK